MVDPDEVAPWRLRLAACLHVLRELDSAVEELNSVLEVQGRSRGGCAARSGPDRGFLDIAAVQPDKSWQAQLEDALRTCRSWEWTVFRLRLQICLKERLTSIRLSQPRDHRRQVAAHCIPGHH
jgi:hypothetical protein